MRNVVWLLAAFIAAFPLAAQTTPIGQPVQPATRSADPVLQPGDIVHVGVWRQPDFSGEFEIGADGTIGHPLYRAVKVTGVPLSAAYDRMYAFLRRYEETPTFTMTARFRVIIGGEVREPKLYTLPPEVTISQAIALAGGPTERANLEGVRLIRGNQEMVLDLTRPESGAATMPIRSGDQIIIPRRRDVLRDVIIPASSVAGAISGFLSLILLAI